MSDASELSTPVGLAHAIHSGGFYGAEKVICDLAREQASGSGYAPRLLAILDPGQNGNEVADRVAAMGLPVSRIHARPGLSWDGLRAYARALLASGIRIVHSHGYKATALHLLSRWAGMHRVPLLVTAHGYPKASGGWKASAYRRLDIALLTAAEAVVAVSGEMESYLRSRNPFCRLRTIPNGIQSEIAVEGSHPLHRALGWREGRPEVPVIGSAGRLVPMKNHAMLIRAYARVRKTAPCRLVILGDGPLRPALEALWRERIPDEPVGLFPFQDRVLEWISDMDVFTMPSEDGEGLPMALLEAGLLERPVVCTDSGGMPEVVHDWVTGRLVHMGDEAGLALALEDLLLNPEHRPAMGRALRKEVLASHDIRATHDSYLEAYAQVLAGT
jgi:glycosyltransferase involved in cell wall biosynthesis